MVLSVQNIGKMKNARIEIDGVTVITGYNSTGKSSICKALYGIMDSYSNMNQKVFSEKQSSLVSSVYRWQGQASLEKDIDEEEFDNLSEYIVNYIYDLKEIKSGCISMDWLCDLCEKNDIYVSPKDLQLLMDRLTEVVEKDIEEYIRFIVSQNMKNVFGNQIGHVNLNECSMIELSVNSRLYRMVFENKELKENKYAKSFLKRPIYIEPESVLNNFERVSRFAHMNRRAESIRPFLLADEIVESKLTLEQYQEREKNIKLIKEILEEVTNGHLVKGQQAVLSYAERGLKENIACKNVASGLKPFLMIQRMVENGSLESGRLLIIDEPEVNLHPAWQLKLAKVLVLLNTELKIQVLISTHSPYFLKAVDYYMEEQENTKNGRYYLTKEISDDQYTLTDVTENKELIYKTMYEPLEEMD